MKSCWTPEEDRTLLDCRRDGLTFEQASRKVGRTFRACKARYYLITGAEYARPHVRAQKPRVHPGEIPPSQSFMNPFAGEMIARANERADIKLRAGTAPSAVVQEVEQETGIRLNVDDLALRPAGEAAERLLGRLEVFKCTA